MDLATENRFAALLMEEARRLRAEAEKEGVGAYLRQPNVRGRPNSRFLTATVLGVEQANRVVEVNELWRAREKERELDAKLKNRGKDKEVRSADRNNGNPSSRSRHEETDACKRSSYASSSQHGYDNETCYSSDGGGLKDDEVEEFLRSRAKRGRGAIGSRMGEPGPYPSAVSSDQENGKLSVDPDAREKEEWEHRILGPEKPSFMKSTKLPPEDILDAHTSKKSDREEKKSKRRRAKEDGRFERKKRRENEDERCKRKKKKKKEKSKHRRHKSCKCRSRSSSYSSVDYGNNGCTYCEKHTCLNV